MLRRLDEVEGDPEKAQTEEASVFLGIAFVIGSLLIGFLVIYAMRAKSFDSLPESWVFVLLGFIVSLGASGSLYHVVDTLQESFGQLFFVVLLPPIIFEAGWGLEKNEFFGNIRPVLLLSIGGTLISAAVVGALVWLGSLTPLFPSVSFLDALIWGSIISATDPVSVLATFQTLGVEKRLYSLVFGESVMNDAVAIVLYHTLMSFQQAELTGVAVLWGLLSFVVVFVGSLVIGFVVAVAFAMLFKHVPLHRSEHALERIFIAFVPFLAYFVAEGLQLSGVVAILFSGITGAHYTVRNLSRGARRFSSQLFHVLAAVSEALVFLFIGIALPELFTSQAVHLAGLLAVGVAACLAGRWANVYGCVTWFNSITSSSDTIIQEPIPFVLWFSGLRGGVAFALASSAAPLFPNPEVGKMFALTTLFIVILSMLVIGGSIGPMVTSFHLTKPQPQQSPPLSPSSPTQQTQRHGEGGDGEVGAIEMTPVRPGAGEEATPTPTQLSRLPRSLKELDERVLTPIFTSPQQK